MQHGYVIGMLVAIALSLALGARAGEAARPAWMAKAPRLPVTGRVVKVANVVELRNAVNGAQDGDTILLADGHYRLDHFLNLVGKNHVAIRGASAEASKTIISGLGWDSNTDQDDLLRIQACHDVTVAYLTFTDAHAYGVKLEQVPEEGKQLRNISIYACNFANIGTRAIKGTGGGGGHVEGGSIRYCNFENTKVPPTSWYMEGDYITAIDCMRLKDWVIADNYFRDIRGANGGGRGAIFVWVESQNVVSERNVFVGCDRSIAYGNPSGSTEKPAQPHNTGGIIRDNYIVVGADTGIEICWAKGVKVYGNTVLTPSEEGSAIHYHWQELSGITITGNTVRGRIFGDKGGVRVKDNVTGAKDGWFRDVASGDLRLTAEGTAAVRR